MIKENGDYLAVKVPEYAFGFSLRTKDNKSIKRLYWCYDLPEEGYVEFKHTLPMSSEIIGLITDIIEKDYDFYKELMIDVVDFANIPEEEDNQWLIIKKV
jgi:hypothetical protein